MFSTGCISGVKEFQLMIISNLLKVRSLEEFIPKVILKVVTYVDEVSESFALSFADKSFTVIDFDRDWFYLFIVPTNDSVCLEFKIIR